MAVKIVRQPKKIALIGAPSSAGAFSLGSEKAPAALRGAGLAEKLQAAGSRSSTTAIVRPAFLPMTKSIAARAISPKSSPGSTT